MHDGLAADFQRSRQRIGRERQHVGATGSLALVIHQPLLPGLAGIVADRLDGPSTKRHRLRRISDVFGKGIARRGFVKAEFVTRLKIQPATGVGAPALAHERPAIEPAPLIRAGLEGGDRSKVRLGRTVLEILCKERAQHLLAKILGGVASETDLTEGAALLDLLAVIPGTHDQLHHVTARIFRFDGCINRDCPVAVFLVPQAVHQHHRYPQRLRCEHLVHCLLAPKRIVRRMSEDLVPKAELLHAITVRQFPGRTAVHELVVFVMVVGPPLLAAIAGGSLLVDIGHGILLTKGAIVEPVVAQPAIDHRIHRH